VTIPQVADAAGVSKMTVTNYFRRKEDLVFDRAEATIRSLAHAVSARAPGESPLKAIRVTAPRGSPRATSPSARPARRSPG
jgi:AcrR family transcriptional regulator